MNVKIQEPMLQKMLQLSQILSSVNQNWYIGEDLNGKQLGKFLSVEDDHKRKYMQRF